MMNKPLKLLSFSGHTQTREYLQIIKEDEVDFLALFRVIYRGRWLITGLTFVCTIIAIAFALMLTPLFRSSISMYPYSSDNSNLGSIVGLASSLGLSLGQTSYSFQIPDIVKSRRILSTLIYTQWQTNKFQNPTDLITYWEINQSGGFSLKPRNWIKSLYSSESDSDSSHKKLAWEEAALEILVDRVVVDGRKIPASAIREIVPEEKGWKITIRTWTDKDAVIYLGDYLVFTDKEKLKTIYNQLVKLKKKKR